MKRKILIMGLPGAGKTTLATVLYKRLGAVCLNGDEVRATINKDLGFSHEDRIEHATRMGWLCDQVVKSGGTAIADFICPTPETRNAYLKNGEAFIVWMNRIQIGRYADTNKMFVPPNYFDIEVTAQGTPEFWAEQICAKLRPIFEPTQPTALFVGRYQPFHDGHRALIVEGIKRVGQVCIAVRNTPVDDKNPFGFEYVRSRIESAMRDYEGQYTIISFPNITNIFYGRDVGYNIERIDLDEALQDISATNIRALQSASA